MNKNSDQNEIQIKIERFALRADQIELLKLRINHNPVLDDLQFISDPIENSFHFYVTQDHENLIEEFQIAKPVLNLIDKPHSSKLSNSILPISHSSFGVAGVLLLSSTGSDAEKFSKAGEAAGKELTSFKFTDLSIYFDEQTTNELVYLFIVKMLSQLTTDLKYSAKPKICNFVLNKIALCKNQTFFNSEPRNMLPKSHYVAKAMSTFLSLVQAPPNICTPFKYVTAVSELVSTHYNNVKIDVYDFNSCLEKGLGSFCSVGKSSYEGAFMLHLQYKQGEPSSELALLGKGITMDTGGINLKGSAGLAHMKYDMTGSALVLSTLLASSALKIENIHLHAFAMITANSITACATVPGDVVISKDNQTIEITNTDAEGRLVLADGLQFIHNILGSEGTIIDVATLTGACKIALGENIAGLFANNDELASELVAHGTKVGELIHQLPLHRPYLSKLKSKTADFANCGENGYGGAISAAVFLSQFVPDSRKWAHLDIAGTSWNSRTNEPTGWGLLTLLELVKKHSTA